MRRRLAALLMVSPMMLLACGDPDAASESSPLDELFGGIPSPAEQRAQQLAYEEAIATCMREEGWEYTPVDYAAQVPEGTADEDPSDPQWQERYGYGIVRMYEIYEWPYLDEDGNYTSGGPFSAIEDPNSEYMNSLTGDEQTQYLEALQGTFDYEPQIDPVTGEEVFEAPPLEEQGCYGKANAEVYGDSPFNDTEFSDRFNQLSEDIQNDPAIEDAEITWSDCMYEANPDYDFFSPEDTDPYIRTLMGEAKGLELVDVDPDTGAIIGTDGEYPVESFGNPDSGNFIGLAGTPRKLTEAQIAELQATEVELWRVDQDCQEESGVRKLRRQLEQELVDAMREEFPELMDRVGTGGGQG